MSALRANFSGRLSSYGTGTERRSRYTKGDRRNHESSSGFRLKTRLFFLKNAEMEKSLRLSGYCATVPEISCPTPSVRPRDEAQVLQRQGKQGG